MTDKHTTIVTVSVNGEEYTQETEDRTLLTHFLRDELGLTGTHQGCVVGKCGACVVLHGGVPKKSCMMFAPQVSGDEITTVEGMSDRAEAEGIAMETREGATLHPLQMGFKQNHGLQCGFCTPGLLMSSHALLQSDPDPDREAIETAISGNVCRCTGYGSIVDSIQWAAEALQAPDTDGGNSINATDTGVTDDWRRVDDDSDAVEGPEG